MGNFFKKTNTFINFFEKSVPHIEAFNFNITYKKPGGK